MDIKGLEIFIEVAELGSFTKAGDKLGYSQPTISFQIKQLEKELGVSLFDRIGHTVSLTDAGRDALRYAQNICHLSREMLLDTIWAYEYRSDIRTVDVHIRRLREKLEENPAQPEYIMTKWGVGYYFRKEK